MHINIIMQVKVDNKRYDSKYDLLYKKVKLVLHTSMVCEILSG